MILEKGDPHKKAKQEGNIYRGLFCTEIAVVNRDDLTKLSSLSFRSWPRAWRNVPRWSRWFTI